MVNNILTIFLHSLAGFGGLILFFILAKEWPRWIFTLTHWLAVVIIFAAVFTFYARFFEQTSPWFTTVTAIGSILLIELIVYSFIYKGELWFLNWLDWGVSILLAAATIYLIISLNS